MIFTYNEQQHEPAFVFCFGLNNYVAYFLSRNFEDGTIFSVVCYNKRVVGNQKVVSEERFGFLR